MKYILRYDIWDERDIVDEFEGDYFELKTCIKKLRANGATHIEAAAVGGDDDWDEFVPNDAIKTKNERI